MNDFERLELWRVGPWYADRVILALWIVPVGGMVSWNPWSIPSGWLQWFRDGRPEGGPFRCGNAEAL